MVSRHEIESAVRKLVAAEMRCRPEDVDLSKTPDELGIDSLNRLEIVVELEEAVQCEVPDAGLAAGQTLKQLVDIICRAKS